MTIALPGSAKRGFFGRKKKVEAGKPTAQKQLDGQELARLFDKEARTARQSKPGKLNDTEKLESARLSSLRGALYSKD